MTTLFQRRLIKIGILFLIAWLCVSNAFAQRIFQRSPRRAGQPAVSVAEQFDGKVLTTGLNFPWEMKYGPDGMLWVTERAGKQITRVNPKTGEKKTVGTIDDVLVDAQHQGLLGMCWPPKFLNGDNTLYVYYTYKGGEKLFPNNGTCADVFGKIVKFTYDAKAGTLGKGTVVIDKLPAGSDHQGARLLYGPDDKLYLSKGELGHNQFASWNLPNEAQRLPTKDELGKKYWAAYVGKVLRLNLDGSIPADNPEFNGVKSHIVTMGHRNPQGLTFVGKTLFSCEHGPSSDDEINRLDFGGNFGWPYVAGYQDDQAYVWADYSKADKSVTQAMWNPNVIPKGVPVQKESEWKRPDNFKDPLKTFNTVPRDYNYTDPEFAKNPLSYVMWPTIGPSSIAYYPKDGAIPMLRNSLVLTTLKNGTLYIVPLHHDGKHVQGNDLTLFKTQNRYRAVTFSPDGKQIFIATDTSGSAKDLQGNPTGEVKNPGAILVFTYNQ